MADDESFADLFASEITVSILAGVFIGLWSALLSVVSICQRVRGQHYKCPPLRYVYMCTEAPGLKRSEPKKNS